MCLPIWAVNGDTITTKKPSTAHLLAGGGYFRRKVGLPAALPQSARLYCFQLKLWVQSVFPPSKTCKRSQTLRREPAVVDYKHEDIFVFEIQPVFHWLHLPGFCTSKNHLGSQICCVVEINVSFWDDHEQFKQVQAVVRSGSSHSERYDFIHPPSCLMLVYVFWSERL